MEGAKRNQSNLGQTLLLRCYWGEAEKFPHKISQEYFYQVLRNKNYATQTNLETFLCHFYWLKVLCWTRTGSSREREVTFPIRGESRHQTTYGSTQLQICKLSWAFCSISPQQVPKHGSYFWQFIEISRFEKSVRIFCAQQVHQKPW